MTFLEIRQLVDRALPGVVLDEDLNSFPQALIIDPSKIHAVCEFFHTHNQLYFDQLACLTGIDNGPEANTMEVVYTLNSLPYGHQLNLKVKLSRETPSVHTVSDVWQTANWHERETFDLLGISFINHPDPRRILMPTDWIGYPLRKDYEEQETYHGITVKYNRDEN